MEVLWKIAIFISFASLQTVIGSPPNIVFMVADDLGELSYPTMFCLLSIVFFGVFYDSYMFPFVLN